MGRYAGLAAVALLAVGTGVWYFALRGPRDDPGRLQGDWRLVVEGREKQAPVIVRVKGDRLAFVAGEKETRRYRMELRPGASPKEIDLTQLGADDQPTKFALRGVYEVNENKARIAAAPDPSPRPALDAPDAIVWVLERP